MFSTMVTEGTEGAVPWEHLWVARGASEWFWMNEQRGKSWVFPSSTDALQNYTGGNLTVTGPKETASIFATYPAPYLSLNNGFLDQVGVRGRPGDTTFAPFLGTPAYCSVSGWSVGWVYLGTPHHPQLPVLHKAR